MKTTLLFSSVGVVTAAAVTFLFTQMSALKTETRALQASLTAALNKPPPPPPPEPPVEIADIMAAFQRHANKLYFAGQSANWKLADFYIEEIEEAAKAFSKKDVMHGKINVSGLMGALILPEIEELESVVSYQDMAGFQKHYRALINNCNACHTAANLSFIVIQEPRTPIYDSQRYEPVQAVSGTGAAPTAPGAANGDLAGRPAAEPR